MLKKSKIIPFISFFIIAMLVPVSNVNTSCQYCHSVPAPFQTCSNSGSSACQQKFMYWPLIKCTTEPSSLCGVNGDMVQIQSRFYMTAGTYCYGQPNYVTKSDNCNSGVIAAYIATSNNCVVTSSLLSMYKTPFYCPQ